MTQGQPTTRGGHQYRITISDPNSGRPIRGEVIDSGLTVEVHWTETGRCLADSEHPYDLVPAKPTEDPSGGWEPTDEEFQYAKDLCRVPKGTHDPVEFRKFVDKAKAGELSFTCSFVWEGPEPIRAKVGDRIQHPNGCWLEITEAGFKVNATLDTVEFGK
jgi:hypothetical protein